MNNLFFFFFFFFLYFLSFFVAYQQKLKDAGSSGAAELESDISRLALEIQDLDDQRGLVHGSEKMYHHFIDKMEKQRAHSDCPLCHREFDDSDEAQMLKDEMKNRVEAMPAKVLITRDDQ